MGPWWILRSWMSSRRNTGGRAASPPRRSAWCVTGNSCTGAGSARVTVRHLLTMTAGFPADDPWADWQQGLPLEDFSALLSGGVSFAWAPDTKFEYASLGYAIFEPDHHGSVGPVVKT